MREKHGFTLIETLVGLTIITVLAAGAYTVWQRPVNEPSTTPASTPSATVTEVPTAIPGPISMKDWHTYRNDSLGFEIKYPPDFKLVKSSKSWTLYNGKKLELPSGSPMDPYGGLGITIYYRSQDGDCGDCRSFELQDISIGKHRGVRAITENQLTEFIWLYSSDNRVVRVNYGYPNLQEKTEGNKRLLNQTLSTFQFID